MEGQWKFTPYSKEHDVEGGFGYWIESFSGGKTFVEYEKERVEGGYWITHLDATKVFFENPVIEIDGIDRFDAEAAN